MATYDDLCTAVIKNKISSLGKTVALQAVKELEIHVDDDGNARNTSIDSLEKICEQFRSVSGQVAVITARAVIRREFKNLELPLPKILD